MLTHKTDKAPSLEEAQAIVEGMVELVRLHDGSQLLVNEEGRMRDMPLNEEASNIAGFTIVGPALLLSGNAKWD